MKLKYYLIPSEHNDYRPWIITPTAAAVFFIIIWGLRIVIPASVVLGAPAIDATDLMNRVNAERTQRFIAALNTNDKLTTAANGKAQDMMTRSYFAHVDPDGNYVWPRIEAAGYTPYLTLGENLAMDFTSAGDMVNAWMNSPTHRENILNSNFQDQGMTSLFGTFSPGHDTIIAVNLFGTLYKKNTPTLAPVAKQPTPAPTPKPAPSPKPTPPPPTPPSPAPTNPPAPVSPAPTPTSPINISRDLKVSNTSLSGHSLVNLDVIIEGSPKLVTAKLKTQSITMLAGQVAGEYIGSFTFDQTEDLSNQTVSIEARDSSGSKVSQDFPINIPPQVASSDINATQPQIVPVSSEAQIIKVLRIIFGIFALIYMLFLVADAIIIRRAKVNREGIKPNPHILVLLLIAVVTLFGNWH